MDRAEFMRQLESMLQDISPAERAEAIQFYNNYFDDAGPENEDAVMRALENPEKVAETIKSDLGANGCGGQSLPADGRKGMPAWAVVLIVILCICASPVLLGAAGGIIGLLAGVIAAWCALILAFGIMAVSFIAVLILLAAAGGMCMTVSPLTGTALIGAGMVCGGIGILFLMLTVAMAGIVTPVIYKGAVKIGKKIVGKKEAAA